MIYYGTQICPDCVRATKILDKLKIEHKYVDITQNTNNMREFLKLRDTREEFKEIKELGLIGIPCFLMPDGSISFDLR
ncbi:MAG: glutaredoxin [Tissierellia bacterium]|nr:glutaredoxin [Tissierellia bacterium]